MGMVNIAEVVRDAETEFHFETSVRSGAEHRVPLIRGERGAVERAVAGLLSFAASVGDVDSAGPSVRLSQVPSLPTDAEPFIGNPPDGNGYLVLTIVEKSAKRSVGEARSLFEPMFTPTTLFTPERPQPRRGSGPALVTALGTLSQLGAGLRVLAGDGQGLKFEVYFPITEDSLASAREGHDEGQAVFQGHGRVLVVDDEPAVARLTGLVLDQHGFEVDVACSGEDALALITRYPGRFRLIIVDLSMPDLSGVEVLRRARALGCPAPVVLTSGHAESEADAAVKQADFAGYLQKPYRLEALLEVIQQALIR